MTAAHPSRDNALVNRLLTLSADLVERSERLKLESDGPTARIQILVSRSRLIDADRLLEAKRQALSPGQYNAIHSGLRGLITEMALGTRVEIESIDRLIAAIEHLAYGK